MAVISIDTKPVKSEDTKSDLVIKLEEEKPKKVKTEPTVSRSESVEVKPSLVKEETKAQDVKPVAVKMEQEDSKGALIKKEDSKPPMVSENSSIPNNSLLITVQKSPTTSLVVNVKPSMIIESSCKAEVKEEHGALNPKADEVAGVCTTENSNGRHGRHVSFDVGSEVGNDARSHSAATPPSNERGSTPMGDAAPMHVSPSPTSLDKIVKAEPTDVDMDTSSISTDQARPEKRKIVMEAVFVPSLASVPSRLAEAERKEAHQKLEQLRNSIVKKPKNTLTLDTIRDRLQGAYALYPIDLKGDILDVTARRDLIYKEYGGNPRLMYPTNM
ncbi:hypothetical protein B0H11DRAFT_2031418 [Mycena galericulata]|nr:hypothetical protein B0H11DRAFT_2031418 [Mycena galericulata]